MVYVVHKQSQNYRNRNEDKGEEKKEMKIKYLKIAHAHTRTVSKRSLRLVISISFTMESPSNLCAHISKFQKEQTHLKLTVRRVREREEKSKVE